MSNSTLLVTGASGQLGRRVVELLLEAGEKNIIAATRSTDKLADFAARGVDVRYADFDDAASLETAFKGADRLLLISTDAVGVPGLRVKQHITAIKAAEAAGVKHVLYTSLTKPEGSPVTLAPDHEQTEAALKASGLNWTVLRNNIYMDSLIGTVQQALKSGGVIYSACGEGKTAYVSREDCARAAAAALQADFEGTRILDINGAQALTQGDIAQIASSVLDKTISYTALSPEALAAGLAGANLPEPIVQLIVSFDVGAAQGQFETISADFNELTGGEQIRLADLLSENKQAFA